MMEDHGGVETHYNRLLRVGAVIAVAHRIAADHRFEHPGEPASDAVAELMYERHDEVLEALGSKVETFQSETHTFEQLADRGNLGDYALARLPVDSYKPWFDRSVEEREQLIEAFAWSVAAESLTFGGFAYPVSFDNKGLPGSEL